MVIGIVHKDYELISPPPLRVVSVFNLKYAKEAFYHLPNLTYIICLKEETNKFKRCFNIMECEQFYNYDVRF